MPRHTKRFQIWWWDGFTVCCPQIVIISAVVGTTMCSSTSSSSSSSRALQAVAPELHDAIGVRVCIQSSCLDLVAARAKQLVFNTQQQPRPVKFSQEKRDSLEIWKAFSARDQGFNLLPPEFRGWVYFNFQRPHYLAALQRSTNTEHP